MTQTSLDLLFCPRATLKIDGGETQNAFGAGRSRESTCLLDAVHGQGRPGIVSYAKHRDFA